MHSEIEISTYLPLDCGTATILEDAPVTLTIRGEDDGCGELHWWVQHIVVEMIGTDIEGSSRELLRYNEDTHMSLKNHIISQMVQKAEADDAVEADVIEKLSPLVFGREAA